MKHKLITKEYIRNNFPSRTKHIDTQLLKALNTNSQVYEDNFQYIDRELRRDLGILLHDPCAGQKCRPYMDEAGQIDPRGCRHLTANYFCKRFKKHIIIRQKSGAVEIQKKEDIEIRQ